MTATNSDTRLKAAIDQALDTIIDPCSAAAGAPVGLLSMGLVRKVDIRSEANGAYLEVTLALTEPGCMMGALFQQEAMTRLAALDGVVEVEVFIDYSYLWTPSDMSLEYQHKLTAHRRNQQLFMHNSD